MAKRRKHDPNKRKAFCDEIAGKVAVFLYQETYHDESEERTKLSQVVKDLGAIGAALKANDGKDDEDKDEDKGADNGEQSETAAPNPPPSVPTGGPILGGNPVGGSPTGGA